MPNARPRRWPVIPQSLCDRVERLSRVHRLGDVAMLTGLAQSEVSKIKSRGYREAVIRPFRPMPSDFPIMAHRMDRKALCAHYRCGYRCITRWIEALDNPPRSRRGIALRNRPKGERPMPEGFEAYQATRTTNQLKQDYGCGIETLKRWFSEMDTPRRPVYPRYMPDAETGNQ